MNSSSRNESRGLWLGLLGVVIFAMTLPMTRLAVGPAADPQLPPLFVTAGRAAFAGLLSLAYLTLTGAPRVQARHLPALVASALDNFHEPNLGTFSPEDAVGLHTHFGACAVRGILAGRPRHEPPNVVVMSYRGFARCVSN